MFLQLNKEIYELKDKLFLHNRSTFTQQGLTVCWSASGFGICFIGSCISVGYKEIKCGEEPIYITMEIDGIRYKSGIYKGKQRSIVDGLDEGKHTLNFYRESVGSGNELTVTDIFVSGLNAEFLPFDKEYDFKLQIIGDSITCGYGNTGKRSGYYPEEENATLTYGFLAGKALNADTRLIGWSGKGMVSSYNGETNYPISRYFNKVKRELDENCNDGWMPDIAVVNIGTNDTVSVDEDTFVKAGVNFTKQLRAEYPNAVILYFYGMMGWKRENAYKRIIEQVNKFDDKVFLKFTGSIDAAQRRDTEIASHGHPSIFAHKRCAEELKFEIERLIKENGI